MKQLYNSILHATIVRTLICVASGVNAADPPNVNQSPTLACPLPKILTQPKITTNATKIPAPSPVLALNGLEQAKGNGVERKGIIDPDSDTSIEAYVLEAIDVRGRRSSSRVNGKHRGRPATDQLELQSACVTRTLQ